MSTPAVRVSRSYAPPQMLDPMITRGTTTPPAEVKAAKCEDFLVAINWQKKKKDILTFSLQFWIFLRSVPDFRFQQHWPKKNKNQNVLTVNGSNLFCFFIFPSSSTSPPSPSPSPSSHLFGFCSPTSKTMKNPLGILPERGERGEKVFDDLNFKFVLLLLDVFGTQLSSSFNLTSRCYFCKHSEVKYSELLLRWLLVGRKVREISDYCRLQKKGRTKLQGKRRRSSKWKRGWRAGNKPNNNNKKHILSSQPPR